MQSLSDNRRIKAVAKVPLLCVLISALSALFLAHGFPLAAIFCALFSVLIHGIDFNYKRLTLSLICATLCFVLQTRSNSALHIGQSLYSDYSLSGLVLHAPKARVVSTEETKKGFSSLVKITQEADLQNSPATFSTGSKFQLYTKEEMREGQIISFSAKFAPPQELSNYGEFDWGEYYQKKGVIGAVRVDEWKKVGRSVWHYYPAQLQSRMQKSIKERLLLGVSPESPGQWVIPALTLGISPVSDELDNFRDAGVMHLFVVSGLHVGLVLAITWILLYLTRIPSLRILGVALVVVWAYIFITGSEPPAMRAGLVITLLSMGLIIRRRVSPWNSLIAAYLIILLVDRSAFMDVGVLLSFGVVFSLILVVRSAVKASAKWAAPDPFLPRELWTELQNVRLRSARWGLGVIIVATVSWLSSSLITAVTFGRVYLFGIASSLLLFPLAFSIMILSACSLIIGLFHPSLAIPVNQLNARIASLSNSVVEKVEKHPNSVWVIKKNGYDNSLTVFNLPKGSGAIFVDTGAEGVLIDCGKDWIARSIIAPCLEQSGQRVDRIIISHQDASHHGGSSEFPKAEVFQAHTHPPTTIISGNISIETIPISSPGSKSADDNIALIKVTSPRAVVGYISDAGYRALTFLQRNEVDFSCDFLVIGEHSGGENVIDDFMHYSGAKKAILMKKYFPSNYPLSTEYISIDQDQTGAFQIPLK